MEFEFDFNITEYPLDKVCDWDFVEAVFVANTYNGTRVLQGIIKMYITDKGFDEDLVELLDDQPLYSWEGVMQFKEVDYPVYKIKEVLQWHS